MSCVTRILVLRGTTAQRLAFTPLNGELVWDTTLNEMWVGDGTTAGGIPLSQLTQEQIQDIVGALIGDSSTIDVTYDDAGNVLSMDVITSALNHQDLNGAGTNTHAQIDAHIANTSNPHVVTITQTIAADGGTDITVAELETLTDNSDAVGLHHHDSQYYTQGQVNSQQAVQDAAIAQNASNIAQEITDRTNADAALQTQITSNDTDIAQNASDIAQEITDRTNADAALQSQITSNDTDIATNASNIASNDTDIAQNASDIAQEITDRTNADAALQTQITSNDTDIAQNATDIANHIADTANPHGTTFTQAVAADGGTDITAAEAETLTDNSDASTLHNHDTQYKKAYWQGTQSTEQTNIINNDRNLSLSQNKNSDSGIFTWASNELTIDKNGDFEFTVNVLGDNESNARERLDIRLQWDIGAGFVDIPTTEGHSHGSSYHRNLVNGRDVAKIDTIITVVSGYKFRVVMICPTSPSTPPTALAVKTVPVGTGMKVKEL